MSQNDAHQDNDLPSEKYSSSPETETQAPQNGDGRELPTPTAFERQMPPGMSFRIKFLIAFLFLGIFGGGGYALYAKFVPKAYDTKTQCEESTKKRCDLQICNTPPCGWQFQEGWVPERITERQPVSNGDIPKPAPRNEFLSVEYTHKSATTSYSLLLSQNGVYTGWVGEKQFGIPIQGTLSGQDKEKFATILTSGNYLSLPKTTSSEFNQAQCSIKTSLSIRTEKELKVFEKNCDCLPQVSCTFFSAIENTFLEKLVSAANEQSCDKAGETYKALCYADVGIRDKNTALCDRIADIPNEVFERNRCFLGIAQNTGNIFLCEKIAHDDTDTTLLSRQACYGLSRDFSEFSVPANLSEEALLNMCLSGSLSLRDSCLQAWAKEAKFSGLCNSIISETMQKDCYTDVAKLAKDVTLCEKISGDIERWKCTSHVAIETNTLSFCSKIATATSEGKILFDTCQRQVKSNYPSTN